MDLSLTQAAARLGKSPRQVRYMIQQGKLPARKVGGSWLIDAGDLQIEPAQQAARDRKTERLRDAVETGLGLNEDQQPRRRYSIRDLKAFQLALPLYEGMVENLGPDHPSAAAMRCALTELGCGCHRFDHAEKAAAYRAARDLASRAVCELLLDRSEAASTLVDGVEQELMPAFAGLLRRVDRRRRL